ncbi:cardiolipin synthase [Massilia sp. TS11]|uniref:cardiolipin synthase n=1 Tax=Massilia sp. TS11 TaxID=2908003 RepID=UPI001EDAF17F|nr:cardiolipin synthase [Massilia sp. TS11]MCG2584457.1 cardiolipin synthase [Massilia sp. TS11]
MRLSSLLPAWLLLLSLCACAALPEVGALSPAATPTVAGARGPLAPAQARALLERRWRQAAPGLSQRAALEEAATGAPLIAGNQATLLFDGPQTMRAMLAAARAATDSINLESYIFDDDPIGRQFADVLIERQRAGVAVHVLVDAVGTLGTPASFFERLRAAGVAVLVFNPLNPASRSGDWELNHRDHRKLMVVDGRIGFTGGINISKTYANSSLFRSRQRAPQGSLGWRDTHIQLSGPAVAALQWSFIDNWLRQEGGELAGRDYFPALTPAGTQLVRVLATGPDSGHEIYKAFLLAIGAARRSIHITSAYFVPDARILAALAAAAQRGVDVRLILPGVSDHSLVYHAGRASYAGLLAAGVHIAELKATVLHAKTAVIDGSWSTVGSANLDRRSFQHNYELNVIITDPGFGAQMEAAFREDAQLAVAITAADWAARPWLDRLKEWWASRFDYWL